ncbi:MAG TPA: hypothetical protein VE913_00760 [Longimicrobium sp.]|nr:hypothetical protein [Longimicrobium sp.]
MSRTLVRFLPLFLAAACGAEAPEAAPATSPADTAWTLNENGIGPLRVGMTADEARAALGGDFTVLATTPGMRPDPAACTYATSGRLPAGVRVMVEGEKVARVEVDSGTVASAAGARIGDTEARVRELYPRVRSGPHKYTAGHYLTVLAADTTRRLVFETDGQKVLRFRGGSTPRVEYVEGCS